MLSEGNKEWLINNGYILTEGRYSSSFDGYDICVSEPSPDPESNLQNGYDIAVLLDIHTNQRSKLIKDIHLNTSEQEYRLDLKFKAHALFCHSSEENISDVIKKFTQALHSVHASSFANCIFCNKSTADNRVIYKELYVRTHSDCYNKAVGKLEKNRIIEKKLSLSVKKGILGAIIGSLIGTLISSFLLFQLGTFSAFATLFIGLGAALGYIVFSGCFTIAMPIVSTIASLIFSVFITIVGGIAFVHEFNILYSSDGSSMTFKNYLDSLKTATVSGNMLNNYMYSILISLLCIAIICLLYRKKNIYKNSGQTLLARIFDVKKQDNFNE